jgi:tripartite-type tricarboxylate transporter receptor subunit TctC
MTKVMRMATMSWASTCCRRAGAVIAALLVAACGALVNAAHAADWPKRPVKIIAPFAPGGTADALGRIVADHLSEMLHQPFYVENRAGASGLIGSAAVMAAEPDGYTLVVSGIASHIIAPASIPAPPYDGVRDFTHIAYLGGPPVGLLVHPGMGVSNYADYLAMARRSPQALDYTSSGTATHGFLFGEALARKEGLRMNHIPYKGGGPAMLDLVAGHVRIATITFASGAEQVRAGKIIALAVSSQARLAHFPAIPTFRELGYDDLTSSTWFALSGPAHLPHDIVALLHDATGQTLQREDVRQRMALDEIELRSMSPAELTRYFEDETAKWAPIARATAASAR